MKKRLLSFALAILLSFSILGQFQPPQIIKAEETTDLSTPALKEGTYIKGEVVVSLVTPIDTSLTEKGTTSFNKDIKVEEVNDFGNAEFLSDDQKTQEFLSDKDYCISRVTSDKYTTEELMKILDDKAYVRKVEPNYVQYKSSTPTDPYYSENYYPEKIKASTAWNATSTTTPVVAVVDTGVDYTHPDLVNRIWNNPYTKSGLSGAHGYDCGDKDSNPMDIDGHGTHCAGVIAAQWDNNLGIAGISKNTKVMCLKASVFYPEYNDSLLPLSAIVSSFNYIYKAQCKGVKVTAVNCSWGGNSKSTALEDVMEKIGKKGALFVFAAGNNGKNANYYSSIYSTVPYNLSSPYMVVVGATDQYDRVASYSNYSYNKVNLFAPGSNILSTYTCVVAGQGRYKYMSGTSMATPVVTGSVALLAELYPNDNVYQRKYRLLHCVTKKSNLNGRCTTGGMLDLSKFASYVAPNAPTSVAITNSTKSVYTRKTLQIGTKLGRPDAKNTKLYYSVSNKKYAKISSSGKLTAYAGGAGKTVTVTVKCAANTKLKATVKIKINRKKVTKVSLNKTSIKVKAGKKYRLKATVSPSYATKQTVYFTSSNKRYATVGKTSGVVRTKKAGKGHTVSIVAKATDGSGKKRTCKVRIR